MRRRSRAGGEPAKTQGRKTVTPKRRNAPKAVRRYSAAGLQEQLDRKTQELNEALEQQTATADVLRVISVSPGDLEPVFDMILDNALRLCEASVGDMFLIEEGRARVVGMRGAQPAYSAFRQDQTAYVPRPDTPLQAAIERRQPVHVTDMRDLPGYAARLPSITAAVELDGARTQLLVPMIRDEEVIGLIMIYRREVRRFEQKHIDIVKNFAAQAVIAIENTRLLNELRESLDRQTATADVLSVISSSPGDLEPVFHAMLANATRICEAKFGLLFLYDGKAFRYVAQHGAPPEYVEARRQLPLIHPNPGTGLGLALSTRRAAQIADIQNEPDYHSNPQAAPFTSLAGARTLLTVPMIKENKVIGAIAIYRQDVRPFGDKQVELLTNFAAQAVIAIENARLLHDLNKLNQQLEQRVADQVGEIERTGRLRRFLPPQVADLIVASGTEKQLESHRREITALFCDLRGFTGFSESSDPEDVMALLRDYHAAIGQIIIKYSGTLERYAGDGVMVVFNDPVPVENPALQAVLMALEMRDAIGALTETWHRWGHDIGFGIGIAHGFATLGTIGFEGRFDYAAIGTVSNVASRLCDEARPGQILISPRVLTKVENAVTVEPVGEFALKGIRRPLAAHNVLGRAQAEKLN